MPRLRQVPRSEVTDPLVSGMYDLIFGAGVDPLDAKTRSSTTRAGFATRRSSS